MSPQSGTAVPKQNPNPPEKAKIADDTGGGSPEKVKGNPAKKEGDPFAKVTVHDLAAKNGTPFCKECSEKQRLDKKEANPSPAPKLEPVEKRQLPPNEPPPEFQPPPKSSPRQEEEAAKDKEKNKDMTKEKEKSEVPKNFSPPAKPSPGDPRSSKPPEL